MIKYLLHRPVSVIMAFTALFILGVIAYMNVPVSLLPDIPIPEVTVQISGQSASARELENTVVSRIRTQLLQVSRLRDIRSETRDGSATIYLSFEYGANTNLSFIEVNEKIDGAMSLLPRDIERPRVIKASATDIPVLNLNLTLCADSISGQTDVEQFLELSEFAENVIRRRFEQLPQVAMIDISGTMKRQIIITPDHRILAVSGITHSELQHTLNQNNVEPGSMKVRDGYYEYTIRFSSVLRTLEDIENIRIRKNDRIYLLKDITKVAYAPEKEKGIAVYNGKRAVVMSVIKQSEAHMNDMQKVVDDMIAQFRNDYPQIEFNASQSQTELLDYTISNLQQNLVLAFIFVFLVSVIFLRDGRTSFVIGLSLFISLVMSLLFFFLCGISLNVISLTGLILASGMMIDNSIIVTDNIGQYRRKGLGLMQAAIVGTREVSPPMLSSVLTTIAVFFPLIFLSGIAGALFFDQAFSVTVGLLVSYFTGIALLPVLYKMIYSIPLPGFLTRNSSKRRAVETEEKKNGLSLADKIYDRGIEWIFTHKILTCIVMAAVFPLCFLLFLLIPKEKMPEINQSETMLHIEWSENIHLYENYERTLRFADAFSGETEECSALIGQQQFLLKRERELTPSETDLYIRTASYKDIPGVQERIRRYFALNHPAALISFSPVGTIFEKIFTTGDAELVAELYTADKARNIGRSEIEGLGTRITTVTGEHPVGVSFQRQLNLQIDREKLLRYNVSYDYIYSMLRTAFKENRFATLRSQQQYVPIILGETDMPLEEMLNETLVDLPAGGNAGKNRVALSTFVTATPAEDFKTIVAGKSGEFIPFSFYDVSAPEHAIEAIRHEIAADPQWDLEFSGGYFSNKKMIGQMLIILFISIMLMYFILAAQFENLVQPFIVLLEIPIDVAAALLLLMASGHTLNLMSAIGIVVTCGIIINDSILKVDVMNQLRREGMPLMEAIHEAGRRRLKAILMTSFTSIVCMAPLLFSNDLGSNLEKPLAIATIGGMIIGTPVSLFVVPLFYWWIYRKREHPGKKQSTTD